MLSYKDQCLMRRNLGSGDNRIELSVGERAVVGITPEVSPRAFSRDVSLGSGGFNRRTSSLKTCRIRSPRSPPQPAEPPESRAVEIPTPVMLRP
jgi:hypothetical protein